MTKEHAFQMPEEVRETFLETTIGQHFSEGEKDALTARARAITESYEGMDADALSILAYAAERDKFDEYASRLEEHYKESLQFTHPDARRTGAAPGRQRAKNFFLECYRDLNIQPQKRL